MSLIKEIAFIGYPITNVQRSRAFYGGLLGLRQSHQFGDDQDDHVWIEYDVGPVTISLAKMGDQWKASSEGPNVALEVTDFDAMIITLKDAGVPFQLEPQDFPSCRMACVKDPDGNVVTIHQRKTADYA
jgi:catechol 2,3-dioxygenase-like lactoylglutathione lyase family enzyme